MSESVEKQLSSRSESIKKNVYEVCDKLLAAGETISVRLVQAHLPDIKSTSTVHRYYSMWKDERQANMESLYQQVGLSDAFISSLMTEVTRFGAEAESRYKAQASDAINQRNAAIDDLTELDDRYAKQSALVESQSDKISELKSNALLVAQKHEDALDKNESNFKALEKELRDQILKLKKELIASNQSNEHLRTELAKSELKVESNETLVSQIQIQHEDMVSKNESLAARNAELNQQLATQTEKANNAESSITKLESQTKGLQTEISTLRSSIETVTTQKQSKETELAALRATAESSSSMISTLRSNLSNVESQLKSANESRELAASTLKSTESKLIMMEGQYNSLQQKLELTNTKLIGVESERDALKRSLSD